jgi:hypothetical protein
MFATVNTYVERVGALEMNTPETPYEIIMDEFSDDISAKIVEAGRYVKIVFLGYGPVIGANYSCTFKYRENNTDKDLMLKSVGVISAQGKRYFLANMPDRLYFQENYYISNGNSYDIVDNPENLSTFVPAELLKTNYPKFTNNQYIVALTFYTLNTTSDYRHMFNNCANLEYILFWGACDNRYAPLQKADMVVDCPNLKLIGIADNDMVEVLSQQRIESLETLIITYQVQSVPVNVAVNKFGLRPFTDVDVTGRTEDYFIETRIAEYPYFLGKISGSTDANPVSVTITDTENLQHGLIITD